MHIFLSLNLITFSNLVIAKLQFIQLQPLTAYIKIFPTWQIHHLNFAYLCLKSAHHFTTTHASLFLQQYNPSFFNPSKRPAPPATPQGNSASLGASSSSAFKTLVSVCAVLLRHSDLSNFPPLDWWTVLCGSCKGLTVHSFACSLSLYVAFAVDVNLNVAI